MKKILQISAVAILGSIVALFLFYHAVLFFMPLPVDAANNIHFSSQVLDKDGHLLYTFLNDPDRWQLPVDLKNVDRHFIEATLAIEDHNFYEQHGIDLPAIGRAAFLNVSHGRIISGASTISMQTVRLLEKRKRGFVTKLIEMVHAVRLEQIYTKQQILTLYLELAPYGGNIHGIRAASLRYLNKEPQDLNLAEAALLAGLPQSPSRLRPDRYPQRAKLRRDRVLLSMFKQGFIDRALYEQSIQEPVAVAHFEFPKKAPHFSRYIKVRFTSDKAVQTSLDAALQQFIEQTLKENVDRLRSNGVTNGAVVIIDNKTGKVRAWAGSADFAATRDPGQVDGVISQRSPGSALKPFTYALALETGRYSTTTILDDAPSRYAEYAPRNYDKSFRGQVSLREALVDSLNIPAVEVLEDVGFRVLHALLRDAGLKTLSPDPNHYGLSLTLGSPSVRLLELTNAYAMLARLGVYQPFNVLEKNESASGWRLIKDGAAYVIADILSDTSRLEAVGLYRSALTPKIAFKTGTSYGQRDAWTFAYNPEYTVGVWMGNFNGRSSKALVGIEAAAPLAVRIFDWLYTNKPLVWYAKPDTVVLGPKNDMSIKNTSPALEPGIQENIDPAKRPEIISPAGGAEYFISGIQGSRQEINLQAKAPKEAEKLFWFVNGSLYKTAQPNENIIMPMFPGKYHITCADNFGRSATVDFRVR